MSETNKGRILMLMAAICWGLAGVCVKSIEWSTLSIMAARCFIGIFLFAYLRKSFKVSFNKMTLMGALFMSVTGVLYMAAIKLTTAATAIVLQYIAPILVFLFAVIFQHRKIRPVEICIVFMVFFGCVLSFAGDLDPTKTLGNILAILSGITFAGQLICFADKDCNSYDGMYLANLISCIFCIPFMFVDKNLIFDFHNIVWVLILGVFQYGLANILYSTGCQKIDKVEGSLILMIEPVFNPIPVLLINGEKMSLLAFIGFVIVIIGVILNILVSNKQEENNA
ncbi:MAG: DMT family transporter [Erysipelotrichaceae bacterium]|nr:DMT family transporter [Erysipelotrichaceae bacterium]